MEALNFYPVYRKFLDARTKKTSIRFGDKTKKYPVGETVQITCGWLISVDNETLGYGKVVSSECKKIRELDFSDPILADSLDCKTLTQLLLTLGLIYQRVVSIDDFVTLIEWEWIE